MSLGNSWEKCNIKEKLGIDIEKWEDAKIYNIQMPDMREKVKEYIGELETEIGRCEQCIIDNGIEAETTNNMLLARCETLHEIIDDLKGRLEERI